MWTMVENLWFLTAISIFILVLLNDPKSSAGNVGGNPLAGIFSSATKGQQSLKNITWGLILLFYILTVVKY